MIFDWIQRIRHAKGYGVHSPFAFNFITNVVYNKYWYYAFNDLECVLLNNHIYVVSSRLNHLSYRLIQYFKPKSVLDLGSGNGINTLYICHSEYVESCDCFEKDPEKVSLAEKILGDIDKDINFVDVLKSNKRYDSIFINIEECEVNKEKLFELSNKDTFWVVYGIKSKESKMFWKSLVKDERVIISFDIRDIGIVLLDETFNKRNYLI